jgi:2-dehydropantoate 2-reductase
MNILSFGAGAIGTYVGGSLALAGHSLVFLEQPQTAAELRRRGLTLDLAASRGRRERRPAPAIQRPTGVEFVSSLAEALERGPFDFAIFALKSFDTRSALEQIAPLAGHMPPVLCLQNGVDNEPALAAVLGADKVIPGTVTSAVGRRAAGDIVLERLRGMGLAGGHPLARQIVAALEGAGLRARSFRNAPAMKWSKMLTNLPVNASAAILGWEAARVLAHAGLFEMEMRLLREALAVMHLLRIPVIDLPGAPVRALAWAAGLPAGLARPLLRKALGSGRGGKMPSFYLDLHSGRGKSEVDWLNGAVARAGAAGGVPTPVNRALNELLLALTRLEIPLESFAGQPEKLLARIP